MELFEAIQTRRSIRKFLDKPVETEKIERIIEAATLAPNSENEQPWRFIVVTIPELRQEIARVSILGGAERYTAIKNKLDSKFEALDNKRRDELIDRFTSGKLFHFLLACPLQIVVIADTRIIYAQHSCSAAIENLSLAAHAIGLGTCWTMVGSINPENEKKIRQAVGHPEDFWEVAGVLAVGYPDQQPRTRERKPLDEVVDWK